MRWCLLVAPVLAHEHIRTDWVAPAQEHIRTDPRPAPPAAGSQQQGPAEHSHGELRPAQPLQPLHLDLEACLDGSSGVHGADASGKHCRPWTCEGGVRRFGLQRRVRHEIHDLTDSRWDQLLQAMHLLHLQPDNAMIDNSTHLFAHDGQPSTAAFTDLHARSHMHHGDDTFFPFHRRMMLDVETQLQMLSNDCSLTLPYWNWAEETHQFDQSLVWHHSKLGSLQFGCVENGVAANWSYYRGKQDKKSCLLRGTVKDPHWSPSAYNGYLPSWAELLQVMKHSDYSELRRKSENWHNAFHCMIQGDMCSLLAPRDPVFYLHHAMIDRYWYLWQKNHNASQMMCGGCVGGLQVYGCVRPEEYVGAVQPDPECAPGHSLALPVSDPVVALSYADETYHVKSGETLTKKKSRTTHVNPDGTITTNFDPVKDADAHNYQCLCPSVWS